MKASGSIWELIFPKGGGRGWLVAVNLLVDRRSAIN